MRGKKSRKKYDLGCLVLFSPIFALSGMMLFSWLNYITDQGAPREGCKNIDSSGLSNGVGVDALSRLLFCPQFGGESPHYFIFLRNRKNGTINKALILRYNSPSGIDSGFPELKWLTPKKLYIHVAHVNDVVWKTKNVFGIEIIYNIGKV